MSKPEQKLQIQVANYLRLAYPQALWTISPAGLIINRSLGILAVRMGYRKGTLDLLIFEPRGIVHGLLIELKVGDNRPSEEQLKFIEEAIKRRYATAVCWTYEETITTLDNYLSLKGGETQHDENKGAAQEVITPGGSYPRSPVLPKRGGEAVLGYPQESPF